MYESRRQPVLARAHFYRRILSHLGLAMLLLVVSLGAGMWGYQAFEHLPPIDAFLNAAMLLGGMGPVDPPRSAGGKLFAGIYALYAGLVFIVSAALLCTPILHRLLHHFHVAED